MSSHIYCIPEIRNDDAKLTKHDVSNPRFSPEFAPKSMQSMPQRISPGNEFLGKIHIIRYEKKQQKRRN
jgi:hypothetical protein